ncbi:hypothetical protein ABT237_39650 [Streptomyces sp. NPDC001581]|uniref:hypothetical protein n=1 Tax=Streptomyces sp. NPDC001581 TaxID=3154386 RepID=UPI00332607A6
MVNLSVRGRTTNTGLATQSDQREQIAGEQYVELRDPVPVKVPGRIEAVQLFSYGDPHGHRVESSVNPWP